MTAPCPKCSNPTKRHCPSPKCDLVSCALCKSYGTVDGKHWQVLSVL